MHGDIRARSHGNSYVGYCQGGRIIDAVTRHGNFSALSLQIGHHASFSIRKDLGVNLSDAQFFRDHIRCHAVVAREHDYPQPFAFQGVNRLLRRWVNRIRDAEQSRWCAIDTYVHDGLAISHEFLSAFTQCWLGGAANGDGVAIDDGRNPLARRRMKALRFRKRQLALQRASDDSGSERML